MHKRILEFYTATKRDSLRHYNQADVIKVFNTTSWYLDDLLDIDSPARPYSESMVSKINQIYPPEHQLCKAIAIGTKAKVLDLCLSIFKMDSFHLKFMMSAMTFDIVFFRFWMVTFLAVLLMM